MIAMLLALAAGPDEVEILLLSLTYGNVEVEKCLRNVVNMFHHIHLEIQWRQERGLPAGFGAMLAARPLVAVGADKPLAEDLLLADYFRMWKNNSPTIRTNNGRQTEWMDWVALILLYVHHNKVLTDTDNCEASSSYPRSSVAFSLQHHLWVECRSQLHSRGGLWAGQAIPTVPTASA